MGLASSERRRNIYRLLSRKYGLGVSGDSLDYITESLEGSEHSFVEEVIKRIALLFLGYQGAESGLILDLDKTKAIFSKIKSTLNLEAALLNKDVGREGNENTRPICVSGMNDACIRNEVETFKREKCFKIQDAFFGKEKVESALFPNVNMKREYYKNLYELLERRVMRSESIRKKIILNRGITPITKIGSLKGQLCGSYLLLGMLTQLEEDKLHLDDLTSSVELTFDKGFETTKSIFTLGSIVLVEGTLTNLGKIAVSSIGMPSISPLNETSWISNWAHDLNVGSETLSNNLQKLCSDAYIIVLSDVWLDSPEVLRALDVMFTRLSSSDATLPYAVIMCGNFNSKGYSYSLSNGSDNYSNGFVSLASILKKFDSLATNTRFVFVPGKLDPWCPDFLPRPRIPQAYVQPLQKIIKNAHFASNPTKISCFFQNIVVFKQNLVSIMCQNSVLPPRFSNDHSLDLVVASTILDQSNLSPLPLNSCPVLWGSKNCLCIDPAPDLLILADSFESYFVKYQGVICVNPGSFMNSGFSFATYQLYNKQCNISKVVFA